MSVRQEFKWDLEATDSDIFEVFQALETALSGATAGTNLEHSGYFLKTKTGINMHRVTDIRDALAPTGETEPQALSVTFERPALAVDSGAITSVTLRVSSYLWMSARIEIWGENNNETYGFIETTKNRITAAVKRLNENKPALASSAATPLQGAGTTPSGSNEPANPVLAESNPTPQRSWQKLDLVMRHPFWSALVVGLILLGLTLLLT
ncbi:hypothetical protein A6I87_00280 [Prescottella equi]|uniref:hypothetical protein n=1 Tax=Rhodococcus hoagii TaxID=43767 RepID=UPI000A0FB9B9|nr:hypothetical protein [Prescottella equi]ORL37885.1 hypothetical protein A6I87_00280 [Prescottella equi]